MRAIVLGSAAGGGVPQWNCGCAGCANARAGRAPFRSEACVAVSAGDDGQAWLLLGAPAAVATLVARSTAVGPAAGGGSRIRAVLIPNGDLDQTLGLLTLREGDPLRVLSTAAVRRGFADDNPLVRTLERTPEQLSWPAIRLNERTDLGGGLTARAVPVPGKQAIHVVGNAPPGPEDNVAWLVSDGRATIGYAPAVARDTDEVSRLLAEADLVFFDGTFWYDDELARAGRGRRTAREMGHWALGGPFGSLPALRRARARVVLVHVNNTNPILDEGSPERSLVQAADVEVSHDGWEVTL